MSDEKNVMGIFADQERAAQAIEALKDSSWHLKDVFSPFPEHKILDALKLKKSRVGHFTLAGGILGFLTGFGLATFAATRWDIIVSGKPVFAPIPFFIIGFEFTILFAVLGNIIGLMTQTLLPEFKSLDQYDGRCSGEHFGLLASCRVGEEEALEAFFKERGGEVRVY